jgi:hypothetical protein
MSVKSIVQEIKLVYLNVTVEFLSLQFHAQEIYLARNQLYCLSFVVFLSPSRQLLTDWDAAASFSFVSHLQSSCHSLLCMT